MIEFAFGRVTLRFAIDELLEYLLGPLQLAICAESVAEVRERIGQPERVARTPVELNEPLERLDASRQACSELVEEFPNYFVLAGVDHGDPRLLQDGHGFFTLACSQQSLYGFLHRPEIFLVGFKHAERERSGLVPVGALDVEIEEELGLLAALFKIRDFFKELRSFGRIPLRRVRSRLDDGRGKIVGLKLKRFIGELFAFRLVTTSQGALGCRDVAVQGLFCLTHGLIEIGEAYLNPKIIGLRQEEFLEEADGFRLPVVLQVNLGQLQKQGPRFAHDPLLHVEVGKLLERADLFGSKLCDALVNCDGLGEKTISDKNLRKAFEIIDSLKGFALTDVQLADGHKGDLIARLVLQYLLVFGDGLGHFALVQQLLCSFDVFALVKGHARTGTILPRSLPQTISSNCCGNLSRNATPL